MNRIFKVIFNQVLGRHVVVSEVAGSVQRGVRKAITVAAAGGALAMTMLLPVGEAGAFSSSYVSSYNNYGYSSSDYQTDGGHVTYNQIGGYDSQGYYSPYVYVNDDGTININKVEDVGRNDISAMVGNVAIGNFATAGAEATAKMVNFNLNNGSSTYVAYETKPETGSYSEVTYNGKTYWVGSNYASRTYAYSPTYNYGGSVIELDGKYYHQQYTWQPDFDDEGNVQYDENGNMIGSGSFIYSEIGSNIWKQDTDNPSGNLLIDYKNIDENGNPVFDLTAEDLGLDPSNPYSYSGGTNNVAVGNRATTTSHSSVAVGDSSTARGWRSIAIGAGYMW